jgi:hypothetical protein
MAKTKKSERKSAAEYQRLYRERKKQKNCEEVLRKERLRWHRRCELNKVKLIADLTECEQRHKRKEWRLKKATYHKTQARLRAITENETPPGSEDGTRFAEKAKRGRKKVARNRTKANRVIVKLSTQLKNVTRVKDVYKKQFYRLKQKMVTASTPLSSTSSTRALSHAGSETPHLPGTSSSAVSSPTSATPRSKTCALLREIPNAPARVRKALLYHNVMIDELKQSGVNKAQKMRRRKLLNKYRLINFARKSGDQLPSKTKQNATNMRCTRTDSLDTETIRLVKEFYERDDNSRITTGKKQTITKNKEKKQKRLLLDTMVNLHEKFDAENIESNISYVTFTRLRPFWIRPPTAKDRDTCLCKKHENAQLMADKLYQLKVLKGKHCENLLQSVCCDVNEKTCMFRECSTCCDRDIQFVVDGAPQDNSVVVWSEWAATSKDYVKNGETKTAKLTTKTVRRGTLKELKEKFSSTLRNEICRHVYIIRHQFRAYRSLKETVQSNEAVVHIDFSENFACKFASEIQDTHFGASNRQASIHTGVVYTSDGLQSFATISDSYRHDPPAIWSHLKPVLCNLQQTNSDITDLHFFSDGPTTQYRNKINFFLLSTQIYSLGFSCATWNFFESGHGKGAPDAIGGAVKRRADAMVNMGCDIADAHALYSALKKDESCISKYFVDGADIEAMDRRNLHLLTAIVGTMKLHQLHTDTEFSVSYRNLSCFCTRPTLCNCYNLQKKLFPATECNVSIIFNNCCYAVKAP